MTETALSTLIRTRLDELGYSLREAADERRVRGKISISTFHRYASGSWETPSRKAIEGIARAIEVPVEEVETAAGVPPELGRFTLPRRADRLTPQERKAVLGVVDVILRARRDGR